MYEMARTTNDSGSESRRNASPSPWLCIHQAAAKARHFTLVMSPAEPPVAALAWANWDWGDRMAEDRPVGRHPLVPRTDLTSILGLKSPPLPKAYDIQTTIIHCHKSVQLVGEVLYWFQTYYTGVQNRTALTDPLFGGICKGYLLGPANHGYPIIKGLDSDRDSLVFHCSSSKGKYDPEHTQVIVTQTPCARTTA